MQNSGASATADPGRLVRSSARNGLADSALGTRNHMVIAALPTVGSWRRGCPFTSPLPNAWHEAPK